MTPSSWQVASCLGGRGYDGRVVSVEGQLDVVRGVGTYRWHTDWRRRGISIRPELPQPACLDEMTWPSGRTLRTSDPWGRMRLYGLCRTGSWEALACRGGHRSRWYRRLWPRRGKLCRWASFRRNSWLFFQWGGRAMSGSEPKLLVSHQSAFVYYM